MDNASTKEWSEMVAGKKAEVNQKAWRRLRRTTDGRNDQSAGLDAITCRQLCAVTLAAFWLTVIYFI